MSEELHKEQKLGSTSPSSDGIHPGFEEVDEKRLFRKIDWHILPFVCLLELLSFLDRTNIGNARIAGILTDLKLTGLKFNLCSAMFFVTYAFFEVPSNMMLKVVRPSIWLPSAITVWALVVIGMAFVTNFEGLLGVRIILGIPEACLFPGVTFYICLWYPRREQARRVGIFFSAVTLAGAFGGVLAFGLGKLDGKRGLGGWQWIFLVEGLITLVVAISAFFFMYDYPDTAKFLTPSERAYLLEKLRADNAHLSSRFSWTFVRQGLLDPKTYLQVGIYLGCAVQAYAFALFTPSIIAGLGFKNADAQLLSAPPYLAACISTIGLGYLSDRIRARGPLIMLGTLVSLLGYVVLYTTKTPGAGYAGSMIAATGGFPTLALAISWAGGNAGGDLKRGVVIGLTIGIGNLGGICSSFIYREQDAPRYHLGHAIVMAFLVLAFTLSAFGVIMYSRLNRKKEVSSLSQPVSEDGSKMAELGDDSPGFRYSI